MTQIADVIHSRVPAGRTLDRAAMAALAREIGEHPELWRTFVRHSANERCFTQLYRDPHVEHRAGGGFDFPPAHIHGIRHPGGPPATSIHVYSPALWRMGHYQYDVDGTMGRVSMTYADELAESG
jgi:hypothetical protein